MPKVVQLMGRRACTTQRSWGHSEPQAKHVGPAVPEHPALQKNHLSLPARSRLTAVSMVGRRAWLSALSRGSAPRARSLAVELLASQESSRATCSACAKSPW